MCTCSVIVQKLIVRLNPTFLEVRIYQTGGKLEDNF